MKKTRLVWSTALAIGGVPVGCYSGAGAGNDASTTETETDGGLESESGEASGGVDSDAGEDPPIPEGCEPSASPIRRLSHVEYENTLHDSFGEDVVPELALTADPVVGGFSNNAEALTASDLLTRQYYEASRSVAQSLDPNALVGCSDADLGCPEQLIREFGAKVFRRPVTDEEASGFLDLYDKAGGDFDVGARIVVQAMLLSPSFLYRPEFGDGDGRLSGYETANRLSYFLWASMPDDALFAAAEAGESRRPTGWSRRCDACSPIRRPARACSSSTASGSTSIAFTGSSSSPKRTSTRPSHPRCRRAPSASCGTPSSKAGDCSPTS